MAWDDKLGAAEQGYDSFTIGADDRDRLRSMLGPPSPRSSSPAPRRHHDSIERTTGDRLDAIERKVDKLLEDGAAIDDLRTELERLSERVEQLTRLLAARAPRPKPVKFAATGDT